MTRDSVSAADETSDFAHTGPRTLAGRYLRRFWQPVYRSRDLAALWSMPLTIMSEALTLYRGASGRPYLVAVAPPGPFDLARARLFLAEAHQGVQYRKGVWHHFLLALGAESDFLVVDRAGPGDNLDEVWLPPPDKIGVRW